MCVYKLAKISLPYFINFEFGPSFNLITKLAFKNTYLKSDKTRTHVHKFNRQDQTDFCHTSENEI